MPRQKKRKLKPSQGPTRKELKVLAREMNKEQEQVPLIDTRAEPDDMIKRIMLEAHEILPTDKYSKEALRTMRALGIALPSQRDSDGVPLKKTVSVALKEENKMATKKKKKKKLKKLKKLEKSTTAKKKVAKKSTVPKSEVEKSVYGHREGSQGEAMDEAIAAGEGKTLAKVAKAGGVEVARLKGHMKHLESEHNVRVIVDDNDKITAIKTGKASAKKKKKKK